MDEIGLEVGRVWVATGELRGARAARLTPMELRLLVHLAGRPGEVVSREELLEQVWGYPSDTSSRTVFATIERLRRKIERDPAAPTHVLTIGRAGYTFHPAPERAAAPPPVPAALIGRNRELAEARAALTDGALLSLVGPSGVGKTRLAGALEPPGGGRVWWCDLETAGPDEVLRRIARTFELREEEPGRTMERVARLAHRDLLVLDGAERATAEVRALLAGPRPPTVVTTHGPLGLPGERVLRVPPLSTEGPDAPALALFASRVAERRPGWSPGAGLAAVEALVRALDGLPLALEFAAYWSSILAPSQVLERLRTGWRLPAEPGAPARHGTLEAAVAWSFDALEPDDRDALAACSLFRGAFSAEDAEAVIGDGALVSLARLEQRALLSLRDGRARLLDAVRVHARRRLEAAPELEARVVRSFVARWSSQAARWARELPRQPTARLRAAAAPVDDAQAAAAHASGDDAGQLALFLGLVESRLGSVRRAAAVTGAALARDDLSPPLRILVSVSHANALRNLGSTAAAVETLEAAQQHVPSAPECAGALADAFGVLHLYASPPAVARRWLEQARALHVASGDEYAEGVARAELAAVDQRSGDLEGATRGYRAALRLLRKVGAEQAEAVTLGNLGTVELTLGRYDLARQTIEAALAINRANGLVRFESQNLTNLGLLAERTGDLEAAGRWYEAALPLTRRTGDCKDEACVLLNLAALELLRSRTAAARRWLDLAGAVLDGANVALQRTDLHLAWAGVHRREGDPAAAARALDEARTSIVTHGYTLLLATERGERGLLAHAAGRADQARALLAEGEAALTEAGAAVAEAPVLAELRDLLARDSPPGDAEG